MCPHYRPEDNIPPVNAVVADVIPDAATTQTPSIFTVSQRFGCDTFIGTVIAISGQIITSRFADGH